MIVNANIFGIKRIILSLFQYYDKNNVSLILLFALLTAYISLQTLGIRMYEYTYWDQMFVISYLDGCSIFEIPQQRAVLKFYQFCLSDTLFGSPLIIPFLESIGILVVSFLLANKITKSRYMGIIAVSVIIMSNIFVRNSASLGYSTEWVFFFMLAVYAMYKKPELVAPFYVLSVFAKGMTLLFIPVMIYWIWKADMPKRNKQISMLSIVIVVTFTLLYTVFVGNQMVQVDVPFGIEQKDIMRILYQPIVNFVIVEYDWHILFLVMPLTLFGLLWKKTRLSMVLFVFIVYTFSLQILVPLISDYPMGNYRMVPTVIMIGVGAAVAINNIIFERFKMRITRKI